MSKAIHLFINYWPLLLVMAFVCLVLWAMVGAGLEGGSNTDESNLSLDTHRRYGRHRVLYDDGQVSQSFLPETAKFYAEHFGGKVIPR